MPSSLHFLDVPLPASAALEVVAPFMAAWFRQRFPVPTVIQRLAWPAITQGDHVLVSAPTGTGKTLAALVPLLGELLTTSPPASWSDSALRVLYIAPLRALVNDAALGLEQHLADLRAFLPPQTRLPRLAVRTGDTPSSERRRQRDEPPDILFSTPESLAVILSQSSSAAMLGNLTWIVVDEIHSLVGNKRGADLALSLERIAILSASHPRRIGLSATATPLELAARWLVGPDRSCSIVRAPDTPPPDIRLEPLPEGGRFLSTLVDRLVSEIPQHLAVLIFTNTRALAERLSWNLRRRLPEWNEQIAVHHSAIAAERRRDIESRFKRGELRVVVSSTSLELGIDIGSVDLAVLVHPPGDVIRLLQRIGRAGHEPGGIRRGLVLTATAAELLESVVTIASGRAGQCEPLTVPAAPLDVLCQHLLGMCAARSCPADDLFEMAKRSSPYADLERRDFDDCLTYLRGLDQNGEAWLPARLVEDGDCWRIRDVRTARLLRRNLGTILTERAVSVGIQVEADEDDGISTTVRTLGEVDESFADRLQPGDRFLLDGRCLEFRRREGDTALVEEVIGRPRVPRWTGSGWPLSSQLAHRLYLLRIQSAEALREGPAALQRLLGEDYELKGSVVELLSAYFLQQESESEIPDASTLLIEAVRLAGAVEYYLHTPLNRPANDALARIAVRRLTRDLGKSASSHVADLGFVLRLKGELGEIPEVFRQLLAVKGMKEELDASLSESETLKARFVRVAQTGLMLLRNPEGRPRKVGGTSWAERRLFEQVRRHDERFVLLRQTMHEVREELCDVPTAWRYACGLPALALRCRWLARPSPFALAWTQNEPGVTERPLTPAEALAQLHQELTGGSSASPG
jgi:ATP-dependent Lhr-like helicase